MCRLARRRAGRLAMRTGPWILVSALLAACTSGLGPGAPGCGGTGPGGPSPACSYPPTAPPGVADQASAVARARAAAGDGAATTTVVWASVERAGPNVPPGHDWLWVVRLAGEGLGQSPCPSGYLGRSTWPRRLASTPTAVSTS